MEQMAVVFAPYDEKSNPPPTKTTKRTRREHSGPSCETNAQVTHKVKEKDGTKVSLIYSHILR